MRHLTLILFSLVGFIALVGAMANGPAKPATSANEQSESVGHAFDCDKPIAQLSLKEIDTCKMIIFFEKRFDAARESAKSPRVQVLRGHEPE
jgi:hypothetical protein